MTAFQATYSDWKLIRTRKVVQIVLEVPVEQADHAYKVLGGMPLSGEETWVGVARLKPEGGDANSKLGQPEPEQHKTQPASADPSPKTAPVRAAPIAPERRMTQRAGMLCADPMFRLWLKKLNSGRTIDEDEAAKLVREHCGVTSRRDIIPGTAAAVRFDHMLGAFSAWQACLEDTSTE